MDSTDELPVKLSELLELLKDIDDCTDGNGDTKCDLALQASVTVSIGGTPLGTQKDTKARPRRKRIRKVGSVPYSTDLQRRRRTELLSLRAEARELECRLTELQFKQQRKLGDTTTQEDPEKWQVAAVIARQEHELAENMNHKLKRILASRLRVFASIEWLLESCDMYKELELMSQNCRQSLCQSSTANSVLAAISDSLEQMLTEADSVFPALKNYLTVALQTHQKRQEVCGILGDTCTCVETISVTPLPCTISKSGTLVWQQLVGRKDAEPDKLYRFIRASHDTTLEMSFTLLLKDETSKLLCVDAVSAYRKFEEENRFVLVGKTTWKPRSVGLELETFHWTVISPSPNSLKTQSCVVQSCNRLHVKRLETTSADARHILTSIGSRLRSFMKLVQQGLLRSATTHP